MKSMEGEKMKKKNKKNNWLNKIIKGKSEGFTFIETLSVIAIGAVLTAGSAVSMSKLMDFAKKTSAKNQIMQYKSALYSYFLDCGCYPTSEQGLNALWKIPELYPIPENWSGPYLENEISEDPWGNEYVYLNIQDSESYFEQINNFPFVILSYGADKKEGGEGKYEDIVSWK